MTRGQLILRSLVHHRWIHFAVACGVAAATAVLTGALLVGDSVRGSLSSLTEERLGKIEAILALDRFFRSELVTELQANPEFQQHFDSATPAIVFPQATLERRENQKVRRAGSVMVLGSDASFWDLDRVGVRPDQLPADDEVVLNRSLADELGAQVGDEVTLRLPSADQVPADSPLANKNDRIQSLPNLKVIAIIPSEGLGRFQLQASQSVPQNAFVSLATLQDALRQPDKINAVLIGAPKSREASVASLDGWLQPKLEDFAVKVDAVQQTYREDGETRTAFEYFTVTTDRMIFAPEIATVLRDAITPLGGSPVLTYLANSIRDDNEPGVPYSMVTAIDPSSSFQLLDAEGQPIPKLAEDQVVLNSWTAERLGAKRGDSITLRFFEPETSHGEAVEKSARFKLAAITPLVEPTRKFQRRRPAEYESRPSTANDPSLTPEVEGVTDQDTIDDWDAPFPFDYRLVKDEDEAYWEAYRTTPKAFIAAAAGQKIWGSRFGSVTSFRVPVTADLSLEKLRATLEQHLVEDAQALGFTFIPIKARQMAAARGTTPFDVLFLFLSFFVIAAALLIVALLFRLGIEQRASEIGTLLAVGFGQSTVRRVFLIEGTLVAALGAVLGVAIGVAYARLMLAGLTSWWLAAISAPFLEFHWTYRSLAIGYILGVATAAATIFLAIRQTRNVSVRSLLGGRAHESAWTPRPATPPGVFGRLLRGASGIGAILLMVVAAVALSVVATRLGGMGQAGAFVGSGAILLIALLVGVRRRLHGAASRTGVAWARSWMLFGLAERSASRNPGRSVITVALMATATFLIVAMSSFRLDPTEQGVGGLRLIGQSSQPVYDNLASEQKRFEYFGTRASQISEAAIYGMRLRPGDDASCQNLYQATQPRVVGVTHDFIERFDRPGLTMFEWGGSAAESEAEEANPWRVLETQQGDAIPVVLDKNTAMYSLHLYRGVGETFEFEYDGRPVRFQVAGLLSNSVLQGSLFISEDRFRAAFPAVSGYRFFLVDCPADQVATVTGVLEERFSDQGLDLTSTHEVLAELLAVQNTYLSTFQSLGALGLLLGAFGLATVQLRNVLERRGELALMRAVGYRRQRLAQLVLLESVVLLLAGLLTGVAAALLAVLPHKLLGESAISWLAFRDLAVMLGAVLVAGLVSSFLTVRAVMRQPLLPALRQE